MSLVLSQLILMPLLAWVVVSDLLYRRIGNRLVLTLLLMWLGCSGWSLAQGGMTFSDAASGLPAALVVLVLGFLLFSLRWMGAGDVKLMSVLCLWMADQALAFLVVTALAGGLLALSLPVLRTVERALALGVVQVGARFPRWSIPAPQVLGPSQQSGLPYGLAIACGAAFVLWVES